VALIAMDEPWSDWLCGVRMKYCVAAVTNAVAFETDCAPSKSAFSKRVSITSSIVGAGMQKEYASEYRLLPFAAKRFYRWFGFARMTRQQ
jgi:hypothetical protein